jgi:3-oxoacyl-(acyl-carrier-protein) synthase
MTTVAITGMGAVTPAGVGVDALWKRALSGRSTVRRIDRFAASAYRCQVAGHADDFDAGEWLHPRFVKKTDRFTHLAMAAADMALRDAGAWVDGTLRVPPNRVAVTVGNVLGGWEFAERELRRLWVDGPRMISPYQATAWFPAAPQGQICIRHGLKGRARTFVCDRASGAYAIAHGADLIMRGQADLVLAGGTEQPLSPYAWLCLETSGYLTPLGNGAPESAYRAYDHRHGGTVVGEGAAFLVLESLEAARARNARVHGELAAWAVMTDGYMPYYTSEPHGETLATCIRRSLEAAGLEEAGVDGVLGDASGVPREDASEVTALRRALGSRAHATPVTAVKPSIGHLMGAAAPADVVVAVEAMRHGTLPPAANLDRPAPGFDLDFVTGEPRRLERLANVLVVSRGLGGVNACLALRRAAAADGGDAGDGASHGERVAASTVGSEGGQP